ncbi:scaffolding protein [Streptomyces phage Keanu]|nr:scaffolding protein [Streptomyces phage Keanu]
MATPVETPAPQNGPEGGTGAPESPAPGTEPQGGAGTPPAGTETPPQPQHGLPGQPAPDGVITSGRGSNADTAPQTPAAPAATPSPTEPQGTTAPAQTPPGGGQQVEDLPDWAQKIIKDARDDAAKTRVNAKTQAAEEARKAMAQDIAKALGITTDETPTEEQLTPEQLRDLLAGERTTAKMARVELAVYRTAQGGGNFNAAALLDSRAFLDSIKDVDPTDNEAIATKIAEAVQSQPWLQMQPTPAVDPAATPDGQQPVTPGAAPAAPVAPPQPPAPQVAPPSGGQFAGGPGAQPQDLSSMSIDDFRRLRRSPRS